MSFLIIVHKNVKTMNKNSFSKLYMQELLIKTAYTGSFRKLCPYIIYYLQPLRSPEKDLYACTVNPRMGYHLSDHLWHPRAWRWAFEKRKRKFHRKTSWHQNLKDSGLFPEWFPVEFRWNSGGFPAEFRWISTGGDL